jgi:hypothetical protein
MIAWQIAASAVSGAAALGAAIGLGSLVSHRLLRYRHASNSIEPLGERSASLEASLDRYRPMVRLLDSEDLKFLASRPGYRPELGARMRKSRRRIFRMYLAELSADFQFLHAAARRMVAEAPEQHADLVPILMRQQVAFWRSLAAIEVRLALSWAGLAPVDATGLLRIVGELQQALAAATAMPSAASA